MSAMLIEAPNVAAAPYSLSTGNKNLPPQVNLYSKFYRKMMESMERSSFVSPPVDTNDLLMRAANALHNANWQDSI